MMKGHVKIELLDHKTGERRITEHENMLTNALAYRAGPEITVPTAGTLSSTNVFSRIAMMK